MDEKTGMQALGRKIPNRPMEPGKPEKMEFEYVRHGTQALIASFIVQSGEVFGKTYEKHTRYEFLDFMQAVSARYPDKDLYFMVLPETMWVPLENCPQMRETILES